MKALRGSCLLVTLLLCPRVAQAQEANDGTTWGWWLVAGSIVVGTTTTALGLNIDCTRRDIDCQREASVLIWGGIGFASIGTLTGITIVEWGERQRSLAGPGQPRYALVLEPHVASTPFSPVGDRAARGGDRGGSLFVLSLRTP